MAMKRAPAKRRPRKAKAKTRGLTPQECRLDTLTGAAKEVSDRIEAEGGVILGSYNDPLGKSPVLVAMLPIDAIEPTPFQRDLSQMHHRKLANVLDRTGIFLDPVIAVTAPDKGFWTPNGRHRLEAMRRLGARSITALVVPKRALDVQLARQRHAGELLRRHLRQEGARVEVDRVPAGRLHDGHTLLGDVVPEIRGGDDAV